MRRLITGFIVFIMIIIGQMCLPTISQANQLPMLSKIPIEAGSGFMIMKKEDGSLWSWGRNDLGQLGTNSNSNEIYPTEIQITDYQLSLFRADNVNSMDAGINHSLAISSTGNVWTWGHHQYALDGGTNIDSNRPIRTGITEAVQVAAGGSHSLALLSSGQIMAWGTNINGQCGNGKTINDMISVPCTVLSSASTTSGGTPLGNIKKVTAGSAHSLALDNNGIVWGWGKNDSGQITSSISYKNYALKVTGITGYVKDIASGGSHNLALSGENTVWAWGKNDYGQLGLGNNIKKTTGTPISGLSNVVMIACGDAHSLALKTDGTVWAWGANQSGQLGNATNTASNIPIQIEGLNGVVAIGAGYNNSYAVLQDGTVWAWGNNDYGQLSYSGGIGSNIPIKLINESNNDIIWNSARLYLPESQTTYTGKSIKLPVNVDFVKGMSGFQFTLSFDSTQMTLSSSGVEKGSLLSDAGWSIVTSDVTPGTVLIIGYNLSGNALDVQGGELLNINFDLGEDFITFGNSITSDVRFMRYPSIVLSDSNAKNMSYITQDCKLNILKALKGDVNFDSSINVLDIQKITNYIAETEIFNSDEFYTGDINDDASINVLDVMAIINIINASV